MVATSVAIALAFLISLGIVRWLASDPFAGLGTDIPNDRSLHSRPTPRLGGVGIILAVVVGWFFVDGLPPGLWTLTLFLGAVFLIDDVKGLSVGPRFGAQIAAASAFVALSWPYPLWLAPLLVLGIVWSANLYNFMDGSNGLAGGMAVIGFGAYAIAATAAGAMPLAVVAAVVTAAAAGFLVWNFDPARIFLGDAGSIPLGFLAAAVGCLGWQQGAWPFWFPVLVFSSFIIDSGLTLAKRILHGEKPWEAHRSHYYQRLVRMGWSHRTLALAEYALMGATALTAIALRTSGAASVLSALALWALAYGTIVLWVDRRWRASPARAEALKEKARSSA